MIRDFLDEVPIVSLFTHPRRFGKTLNMDMLRIFFEKTDEDTARYFTDKKIWKCGKAYRNHQGKCRLDSTGKKSADFLCFHDGFCNRSCGSDGCLPADPI